MAYPLLVWATGIRVERNGKELNVRGSLPTSDEENATDLLRAWRYSVNKYGEQKRQGKLAPYIQFANADTDGKLMRFVERFGPVLVTCSRSVDAEESGDSVPRIATQDLDELTNERKIYHAALQLVEQLKGDGTPNIEAIRTYLCAIAEGVAEWPRQWERELRLRREGQGVLQWPAWNFTHENVRTIETWRASACSTRSGDQLSQLISGPDPIRAGQLTICELINAFPPNVYMWGDRPIEAPAFDLVGGIRPLLYNILRIEYLRTQHSITTCRNTDCRQLFEIERSGQQFCSEKCSRYQRQREYYHRRGKPLRQARMKARRSDRHSKAGK
jgi:hypothetical protein